MSKEIAQKISDKQAEYVLSLEGNKSDLNEAVSRYFEAAVKERRFYPETKDKSTHDNGHGRLEKRRYYITDDIGWLEPKAEWKNLRSVGMVKYTVIEKGEKREETRYIS